MAQIPHTFVEQTTAQTHTGDTMYKDISGASISSGSFTTGRKYLLIFQSQVQGQFSSSDIGMRSVHGSTEFTGSELKFEESPPSFYPYTWFTVWTAVASEDLTMQFATSNSGQTVTADQLSITAIEISEELTENTDWFFDSRTASDSLSTTFTATNPSVTFTPSGSDD